MTALPLTTRWMAAACFLAIALSPLGVFAIDASAVLEQLDAGDYAVRAEASETLLAGPAIDEAGWADLFALARTPEQKHRLLAAARHHVLRDLRRKEFPEQGPGSLGMTQRVLSPAEQQRIGRPGVLVNSTLPGFPAYAHLRPGDLIVAINQISIASDASDERFQQMVQANPAGRAVTLTLIRDGQEIEKTLQLASFEALARMYERSDIGVAARYDVQWRQIRQRLLEQAQVPPPTTIELIASTSVQRP